MKNLIQAAAVTLFAASAAEAQSSQWVPVRGFATGTAPRWNVAAMKFVGTRLAFGFIEDESIGAVRFLEPAASGWQFSAPGISAPDVECRDFGLSLAVDGTRVAVGSSSGHVFVFETAAPAPSLIASWRASPAGYALVHSLSGDTLLVGLPASNGGQGGGALLRIQGAGMVVSQFLVPERPAGGLGWVGGISGDGIILSAEQSWANSHAMTWRRQQDGTWAFESELLPVNPSGNPIFGCSSSIEDNVIAVGARDDGAAGFASGACYIFERVAGQWVQTSKLTIPEPPFANQETGAGVAVRGGRVWISSAGSSENGTGDRGRLLVAAKVGGTWQVIQTLRSAESGNPTFWGYGATFGPSGSVAAFGFDSPVPFASWRLKCDVFAPPADCDGDGTHDLWELWTGELSDADANGVPDSCEGPLVFRVPADFPTIQSAIDGVPPGQSGTIIVSPGTYAGPVDLRGKDVVVRGSGAASTIIQGSSGELSAVVRLSGGEPATAALEQFTIRGGLTGSPIPQAPQFLVGGGIFANESAASVRDCVVEQNFASFGGGGYWRNSTGSIERCTFRGNSSGADGGGIQIFGGSVAVLDCVVQNNRANSRGGGIHAVIGRPVLARLSVQGNLSDNVVGGVSWAPSGDPNALMAISESHVTGNSAGVVQGGIGIVPDGAAKLTLASSTVCGNVPRPNIAGPWQDVGGNTVCACLADLTGNEVVNGDDLGLLLAAWGTCLGSECPADMNRDGYVNGDDLGYLLTRWGPCTN